MSHDKSRIYKRVQQRKIELILEEFYYLKIDNDYRTLEKIIEKTGDKDLIFEMEYVNNDNVEV